MRKEVSIKGPQKKRKRFVRNADTKSQTETVGEINNWETRPQVSSRARQLNHRALCH